MRTPTQPKGMVTDAPAVATASMPEEKRESLIAKLKQAISDEEECAVSHACFTYRNRALTNRVDLLRHSSTA